MKKTVLAVLIFFFALTGTSIARGPFGDRYMLPHKKWWRIPEVAETLKITTEEQEKLDSLYLENRKKMIDLIGNLQKEKLELDRLLESKNFDESACLAQFQKVQTAKTIVADEYFKFVIEVRKLIGPDRFQLLKMKFRDFKKGKMRGFNKIDKHEKYGLTNDFNFSG